MIFVNAKNKQFTIDEILSDILETVSNSDEEYSLIIGTDSQVIKKRTTFVSVIVLYEKGHGARFFTHREKSAHRIPIFQRLLREVEISVEIGRKLLDGGVEGIIPSENIEMHIDIGPNGKSREVIDACVGWCMGIGMNYKIKPQAVVASHVADHFVRQ